MDDFESSFLEREKQVLGDAFAPVPDTLTEPSHAPAESANFIPLQEGNTFPGASDFAAFPTSDNFPVESDVQTTPAPSAFEQESAVLA